MDHLDAQPFRTAFPLRSLIVPLSHSAPRGGVRGWLLNHPTIPLSRTVFLSPSTSQPECLVTGIPENEKPAQCRVAGGMGGGMDY
jgi:hypothetical protein